MPTQLDDKNTGYTSKREIKGHKYVQSNEERGTKNDNPSDTDKKTPCENTVTMSLAGSISLGKNSI